MSAAAAIAVISVFMLLLMIAHAQGRVNFIDANPGVFAALRSRL